MATVTLDTKIFKVVTPESVSDSNYADYEYLLRWFGRSGEPYQYLFKDWNYVINTQVTTINKNDLEYITNVIQSESNQVILIAENLTPEDYDVIRSITVSTRIERIFTIASGLSPQKVSVANHSYEFSNASQRRNFIINLVEYQKPQLK